MTPHRTVGSVYWAVRTVPVAAFHTRPGARLLPALRRAVSHEPCRVLALTAAECGFNVSTGRGGACRALCGTAGFARELAESLVDATQ